MLINSDSPAVILDARTCLWIERYANLSALRVTVRGTHPHIARQLDDIRIAAESFTGLRNPRDETAQPAPESEWMSTTEAAKSEGITPAALRKAIKAKRLPAAKDGRGWRIRRTDLQQYRAKRSE